MKRTIRVGAILITAILAACDDSKEDNAPAAAPQEEPAPEPKKQPILYTSSNEIVEMEADGYGIDKDAAIADACGSAVAQVCGVMVAKSVSSSSGKQGGESATYEGVIESYRILQMEEKEISLPNTPEKEQQTDPAWKWRPKQQAYPQQTQDQQVEHRFHVRISAKVRPPVKDQFRGKFSIVIPGSDDLMQTLSHGTLSTRNKEILSATIHNLTQQNITEQPMLVMLNRSASLADQERQKAAGSNVRAEEQGKARGLKVADYVLDIAIEEANEQHTCRNFQLTGKQKHHMEASILYSLKWIDVTTGGVVASEQGSFSQQATAWDEASCTTQLATALQKDCEQAFSSSLEKLLTKVGCEPPPDQAPPSHQ